MFDLTKKLTESLDSIWRVRQIHFMVETKINSIHLKTVCYYCGTQWPCKTIQALDGE
jgi:predicted molibdopterin-dependent oxidoreductase YjgC